MQLLLTQRLTWREGPQAGIWTKTSQPPYRHFPLLWEDTTTQQRGDGSYIIGGHCSWKKEPKNPNSLEEPLLFTKRKRSWRQGEKKTIVVLGGEERKIKNRFRRNLTYIRQSISPQPVSFLFELLFPFLRLASLKLPFVWLSCR